MNGQRGAQALRVLALLVLAALTPGLLAGVQRAEPEPAGDLARRDHAETLRAERTARFLHAYEAASDERRAACDAALRAVVPPRRPAGMRPLLEELALFTRVLDGEPLDVARADVLARFADALDLRVAPGAFQVRDADAGRGEPLTVHVVRAFPVPIAGEVDVTLFWLAPDGGELRARSEPFSVTAFKPPGTAMYVRAPASRRGTWRLVAEVSRGARSVRGVPVDVRCVEAGTPLEPALRERGLRRSVHLDPALGVRPWQDGPFEASLEPWVLEGGDAGATILSLTPSEESPRALFAGEAGARWKAFAREGGHRIVTLRSHASLGLAQGLEELRRREPARQQILVVRGDAVRALVREATRGALAVDGLVVVGERVVLPRALAEVPALVVAHDLPTELAAQEQIRWVELALPTALLVEAELPAMLDDWWGKGPATGR